MKYYFKLVTEGQDSVNALNLKLGGQHVAYLNRISSIAMFFKLAIFISAYIKTGERCFQLVSNYGFSEWIEILVVISQEQVALIVGVGASSTG